MENNEHSSFNLSTGTDLAFALLVFIAYFSAFSSAPVTSIFLITIIIVLGIAYITNGIYGFSYVKKRNTRETKILYFISQMLIGGLIIYYGKGAGFSTLILLPIVAHSVIALEENWTMIANFGVLLTYIASVWAYSQDLFQVWTGFPVFFAGQVIILIFTQMAVNEQKARRKLEILAEELSEANRHLSEYAQQVHELAVTQERNRFAREIHDGLGHYLTTINMQLSAAAVLIRTDSGKAETMLNKAKKLIIEALDDVRDSVSALHEENADIEDLPKRITHLVEGARSPRWEVSLNVIGDPFSVSPPVHLTIYRAAQETLNNAQKHSNANKMLLNLDYTRKDQLIFTASDNGSGAEDLKSGYGILGLQERVRLLNGSIAIENKPGEGFLVRIELPVDER